MNKKYIIVLSVAVSLVAVFYFTGKIFFTEAREVAMIENNIEIDNHIPAREKDKNLLLIKIDGYLHAGDYDKAIECSREILGFDPESDAAYCGMGLAYYGSGDSVNAVDNLYKAIDLNDSNFDAYYALAGIYRKEDLYTKAFECLEKAVELNPDYPNVHSAMGALNFETGNFHKASRNFKEAARLGPSNVEAYINLGKAYLKANEVNKAHAAFRRAVRICRHIDPEYAKEIEGIFKVIPQENKADLYYTEGVNYLSSRHINEAIRYFEKAIYYSGDSDRIFAGYAYRDLGKIYIRQYKFEEAIEILNNAKEMVPDDADVYNSLGDAYAALSDADKARESYEKAYQLYSGNGKRGRANLLMLHKLSGQ